VTATATEGPGDHGVRIEVSASWAAVEEATGEDLEQDLAEVEFFIAQGLVDDAREMLDELRRTHPGEPRIAAKLAQLDRSAARAS
jgi:hypothetical protein